MFPVCGSTALLAALAQVPESEVPGVRLVLRPDFDVTVEQPGRPTMAARRFRSGWARCWTATGSRLGTSRCQPRH